MMRKPLKIAAWVMGSVAGLLALLTALVLVAGNTDPGRAMIERITAQLTGGMVQLSGLGGSFPTRLTLRHLDLTDQQGVWLTADAVALTWTPLALLERRISVDSLEVAHVDMERTPHSSGGGGKASVPHIEVRRFDLEDVRLGAELAGRVARVSLRGGMDMRSLDNTLADVTARRIDGDGEYAMHLNEPASGPLENILKLPGLGALDANISINGPHEAELIDLKLTAGQLKAAVSGRIDLRQGSMDVN
jgi:translocation and assembly module TamB